MPLVTSKEMFQKAYEGGYAVGAFNVNNMEIIQGIVEAAKIEQSPLILQVCTKKKKELFLCLKLEAAWEFQLFLFFKEKMNSYVLLALGFKQKE